MRKAGGSVLPEVLSANWKLFTYRVERTAGGPLKPYFGLSGVVLLSDRVSPLPVRAFLRSTRIPCATLYGSKA